jgi:hypothetical protein
MDGVPSRAALAQLVSVPLVQKMSLMATARPASTGSGWVVCSTCSVGGKRVMNMLLSCSIFCFFSFLSGFAAKNFLREVFLMSDRNVFIATL